MSLKQFIKNTAQRESNNTFRNMGYMLKASNNTCGGLAKVLGIKDNKYIVRMADGSKKEISPSGVRGIGPDGIILLSDGIQVL